MNNETARRNAGEKGKAYTDDFHSNDKVFDFISETFQLNRVEAISARFFFRDIRWLKT